MLTFGKAFGGKIVHFAGAQNVFFEKGLRHVGHEIDLAAVDCFDGVDQLGWKSVFANVASRSCLDHLADKFFLLVNGQNQDLGLRADGAQTLGRFQAVHSGHGDIHHHHVGRAFLGPVDRLGAAGSLADNLEALVLHQ